MPLSSAGETIISTGRTRFSGGTGFRTPPFPIRLDASAGGATGNVSTVSAMIAACSRLASVGASAGVRPASPRIACPRSDPAASIASRPAIRRLIGRRLGDLSAASRNNADIGMPTATARARTASSSAGGK